MTAEEFTPPPVPQAVQDDDDSTKYFGTLEFVREGKPIYDDHAPYEQWATDDYGTRKHPPIKGYRDETYWHISGAQPAIMVNRIMDHKWGASTNTANVEDTITNVRYLDWLMKLYPLKMPDANTAHYWRERLRQLQEVEASKLKIRKLDYVAPGSQFKGKLMDFQQLGLDFLLKKDGRALLADEMGLGKTAQSLAYLATAPEALPALIVAPLVTLENWRREIVKFIQVERAEAEKASGAVTLRQWIKASEAPTIKVIRSGKSSTLEPADFYIINYDLLDKRKDDIMAVKPCSVIADEAHNLRNAGTQKYQAIKEISAIPSVKHRIGLSGTPLYNRGAEIWPLVDWIEPGLLGTHADFCALYCDKYDSRRVLPDRRTALYEVLAENVMLRRRKVDVLKDLPEKIRHKEAIEVDIDYYKKEMREAMNRLDEQLGKAKTAFDRVKAFQGLKMSERQIAGTAKIPAVVDFVKNVLEQDESVVVFCHHMVVHDALHRALYSYNPASVVGGQSDKVRQENIDRFQRKETQLIIVGLRAGNVGISLVQAPYVIFAELDWTPAVHWQAEDRLHRIGQKQRVFAYYLEGQDTLDEVIVKLLTEKTLEIKQVTGDAMKQDELPADNDQKAEEILAMIKERVR